MFILYYILYRNNFADLSAVLFSFMLLFIYYLALDIYCAMGQTKSIKPQQ
jgi:hypothetical protein